MPNEIESKEKTHHIKALFFRQKQQFLIYSNSIAGAKVRISKHITNEFTRFFNPQTDKPHLRHPNKKHPFKTYKAKNQRKKPAVSFFLYIFANILIMNS
ncbi:MAG: hypothetical protein UHJ41_06620 [Bacteroidaceae bacterium]|nr:hypothetical protein [Bacteroidaceae bacterium]